MVFLLDAAPLSWSTREEFHLRLSRALVARGITPVLTYAADLPADIRTRLEESGAAVRVLNYGPDRKAYFRALGAIVREFRVETAHVRFFDYFSAVPWLARLRGVRRIVFTESNGGEYTPGFWKAPLIRLRTRLLCHPITRVIAISDFIRRRLVAVGIPERKIHLVYNGIDTEAFHPGPSTRAELGLAIPPDELLLLTLSALVPIKNVDLLIRACAVLRDWNIPARLLIAGDGPMRRQLEQLAAALGVADHVCFLGHSSKPASLLQAADIFLLATSGEAFGHVLAEAQACGVPAIGSRSGGIGEIIEHEATGLTVPSGDPQAFAAAIARLAGDPALRRAMGARGVDRARRLFSIDTTVAKTLAVYDSLPGV